MTSTDLISSGRCDHRFAERKADTQILEIGRRREHDHVRCALIGQRDGLLFGHAVERLLGAAVDPALDGDLADRAAPKSWWRSKHQNWLTLCSRTILRCRSVSSWWRFCHSEG